jgi:FAD/FMN-containing dehydrogenase
MGRYGLTIDNVRSVEIVTADGRQRRASADEHPDLYWAVRGGSGNFGVVTTFEYDLHPARPLLAGMVAHPAPRAREVLRFYRDFISSVPDELTAYAAFASSPDGHPIVAIAACYSGPLEEGEKALAPIRQFGPPLMDTFHPMSYGELNRMLDAGVPSGRRYYEKGLAIRDLSDGFLDTIAERALARTSPFTLVLLQHVHGKAARVGTADTAAFALRGDHIEFTTIAGWDDGADERHVDWTRGLQAAVEPYSIGTAYVNSFGGEDGQDRVRKAYGDNYPRLARIKATYDPENLFRPNANVRPRTG